MNVHIEDLGNNSFTLAWERPDGSFDCYSISTVTSRGARSDSGDQGTGSCAKSSPLLINQTSFTCDNIDECTSISVTVSTIIRGPPLRSSAGVTIRGIFIPGKAPEPPTNLTVLQSSPLAIQVRWNAPHVTPSVGLLSYSVDACELEAAGHPGRQCKTHETLDTSLELVIARGAAYWVEVSASTLCDGHIIKSTPIAAQFASPPREVTNLRLASVGDHSFSAAWDRPNGHFDYYWVDVTDGSLGSKRNGYSHLGLCGNATIIPPDQTRMTCTNLEACANVTLRVRTHNNGPPARTSHGVTLGGIYIPGGAPEDFDLDAKPINKSTVEVTLHLSNIKPCLGARCHGVLLTGSRKVAVPCQDYVGKEKTLSVRQVERQRMYIFSVTMASAFNSKNITKSVIFRIP
ncbi:hypothetical protein V5799_024475 [Amblyomma americanum]|uniref:Fibronectin type-III domain-containing protein n=1 Tax=Amblyomma americanum TaxID=6943 RepID=A0AAQ4EBY5_AMBAM